MSDQLPWPPDDVLIELGRIAWAAMDLEGVVKSVAQAVIGAGDEVTEADAGKQMRAAVAVLDTWPQSGARDAGRRWLIAAQDVLLGRHSVLHATIVNLAARTAGDGWELDPALWLQHVPPKGRADEPVQLAASELRAVRDVIVDARRGWTEVIVALSTRRRERWGDGQIDRSYLTKRNRHG